MCAPPSEQCVSCLGASSTSTSIIACAWSGLGVFYGNVSLQRHPARRLDTYLGAAADLARRQWTQFGVASMGRGLAVLAATLAVQLAACWALMRPPLSPPSQPVAPAAAAAGNAAGSGTTAAAQGGVAGRRGVRPDGAAPRAVWQWGVEGAAWAAVLGHAAALFSNSFILAQVHHPDTSSCHSRALLVVDSEAAPGQMSGRTVLTGRFVPVVQGRMLAFLLAALVALLGRSTVSLLLQCQQAEQQAAAAQAVSTDTQRQVPASSSVALMSGQGADADASQGGATPQPAAAPGHWRSRVREAALLTLLLLAANWALAAHGLVSVSR